MQDDNRKTAPRGGRRARTVGAVWLAVVVAWTAVTAAAMAGEESRVLADFADGSGAFNEQAPKPEACAGLGGAAVKIGPDISLKSNQPGTDWNRYTFLRFEVFNPGDAPVVIHLMLKDNTAPHGYFSWVNRYVTVAPGKHGIEFQIAALKRGEGSPKDGLDPRPIDWSNLQFAMIASQKAPVFIGNVRLVKEESKSFAEMRAFDFGPKAGGVCFLGFTEVTPETSYDAQQGYGWVGAKPPYARHRSHPADELVGDWISAENATFRVDLPNGPYQGVTLFEDPGEWELYQNFTHRSLTVNGVKAVDEKQTGAEFLDRYFHFAETEDHPGDDIWDRYVAWRYPVRSFQFEVTDGKAEFNVRSNGQYAGTWNMVAVWPQAKAAAATAFLSALEKDRRKAMAASWTEKKPVAQPLDEAVARQYAAQGYVPFSRGIDGDVNYFDAPTGAEAGLEKLTATGVRGQRIPLTFAIRALRELPELKLTAGEFKAADGGTLPAAAMELGYVNFKFKRLGFGGQGMYGAVPFIIKPFSASEPTTAAAAGTARQFWVTVTVPADQAGGSYVGVLKLQAPGLPDRAIPVTLNLGAQSLPDADIGLGFFGYQAAPHSAYNWPENQARLAADNAAILRDLRAHGSTMYVCHGVQWQGFTADKQGRWNVGRAKAEVAAAKAAGFQFIYVFADGNGQLNEIALDPEGAAKKYGFADGAAILKASYGSVAAACEAEGVPAAMFSFGDEPSTKPVMDQLLKMYGNIRTVGATGAIAYSTQPITLPLLDVLGMSSLNHAKRAEIERAIKAGNRVFLNNQGRNRWAFGWYMWKARAAGVEAYQQFIYNGPHVDPYNPFDGIEDDESMVYPDRQGRLRARIDYERIAQGITDYRLLKLLKQAGPAEGWAAAEAKLATVRFEETAIDRKDQMSAAELAAASEAVAQAIVNGKAGKK